MKNSQNIIDSSIFNFQYENKISASRCNSIIESIFHNQIFLEINTAISNKIPEGVHMELSKLEIDIGIIEEKDILSTLAHRIRIALEESLQAKMVINGTSIKNGISYNQQPDQYIFNTIELFLEKGYFPFWIDKSISFDDLVQKSISQSKNDFLKIINTHKKNEKILKRLVNTINSNSFESLLEVINPVNTLWILNFKKSLIHFKKQEKLNQFSSNEFSSTIDLLILEYLLNSTSQSFNKADFLKFVLKKLTEIFKLNTQEVSNSIKKQTSNSEISVLLETIFSTLNNDETFAKKNIKKVTLEIDQLIAILNNSKFDFKSNKTQLLKQQILETLYSKENSNALMNALNSSARNLIINLFYSGNSKDLMQLISSFTKVLSLKNKIESNSSPEYIKNKFVLLTAKYFHEKFIRLLNKEEYLLFLIYISNQKDFKIVESSEFQIFLSKQKNMSSNRMSSVVTQEINNKEIFQIQKTLSNTNDIEKRTNNFIESDIKNINTFYTLNRIKIINFYLENGYLLNEYLEFSLEDIKVLYSDLISEKSDFLFKIISTQIDSTHLFKRIKQLLSPNIIEITQDYLIHFYPNEYDVFSKLIGKIDQYLYQYKVKQFFTSELIIEVFIKSLIGKGVKNFKEQLFVKLIDKLSKEQEWVLLEIINQNQDLIFESDGIILKSNNQFHSKNVFLEIRKSISQEYSSLINTFDLSQYGLWNYDIEISQFAYKIFMYSKFYSEGVLDIFQERTESSYISYILLKHYLKKSEFIEFEKLLLSSDQLKSKILKFKNEFGFKTEKQKNTETISIKKLNRYKQSNPKFFKAYLILLLNDYKESENLISIFKKDELPKVLLTGEIKIDSYLQKLMSFSPIFSSNSINESLWKIGIMRFSIYLNIDKKSISEEAFSRLFIRNLFQNLKEINHLQEFYPLLNQLRKSKIKELHQLVSYSYKPIDLIEIPLIQKNNNIRNSSNNLEQVNVISYTREIEEQLSVLFFYLTNSFFPWWSEITSLTENIFNLKNNSQLHPVIFEKVFLRIDSEEKFIKTILKKLNQNILSEFELIISNHSQLKNSWEKARSELVVESEKELVNKTKTINKLSLKEIKNANFNAAINNENYISTINLQITLLTFFSQQNKLFTQFKNINLKELLKKLKQSSELYPAEFEQAFIKVEQGEKIMISLLSNLDDTSLSEFELIVSKLSQLNSIWQKTKDRAIGTSDELLHFNNEQINIENETFDEFYNLENIQGNKLIFKNLYLFGDEIILNGISKENKEILNCIQTYLNLSKYFYFRNINPMKWRELLLKFTINYLSQNPKGSVNQFEKYFLIELKKNYSSLDWSYIFKSIYTLLQSSNNKNKAIVFPEILFDFFDKNDIYIKQKEEKYNSDKIINKQMDTTEIKIYNAGLILFGPFLPRFFELLELTENQIFVNEEAKNRGVYLLQCLVTNDFEYPEYYFPLNKLLVGMELEEPISPFIKMTETEKEVVSSLLDGLIANWEKVKNSSHAAIQETFLQREGVLRIDNDKVTLIVSKKGVDILMESIPWNISLVKLKWMKNPIYVEWI
ncbi:contractile injection system tape measure protein [Urechidicola croceus]|uniref:Uncharacterized protein n=1 Tax=Urechidicola croceus TaxID=1850246 RepID=A0A1D8P803_9FLAO|nr:contractile injection system tape measure protein [Urechidicola croceus]AOW20702.1 hypothetical protein LPB138_08445 [Urechidicola croceus]